MRVIEAAIARQRKVFGEDDFRSHAERRPLHPVVLRITVFGPLVDEDWHHSKTVVWLKDHLFSGQKLSRVVDIRRGIRNHGAAPTTTKVAGSTGSVLDAKRVIATVPLQSLMAKPKRVAIGCRNSGHRGRAGNCGRCYRASF